MDKETKKVLWETIDQINEFITKALKKPYSPENDRYIDGLKKSRDIVAEKLGAK